MEQRCERSHHETSAQAHLRLPTDMKTLLEREARMNASSLNSEVVRAVRERMHRQGTPQRMEG